MSADSPRRGVHKGAQVVSPQPIVDRSIIDSVAGIINDIVPQAYAGTPNSDNKESISWARFEYADINDPALYPDYNEGSNTPPLLLVLGYTTGVQVWLIAATGEATEVLSWPQGVVRTLRILPNPKTDNEHVDLFELKRPMVAICDSAGPGPQFCNISFISLKSGEQAKSIKFKNPVCDILANKRSIVVTFLEKIAIFDARTLEDVLTVTTCYASPGPNPNPVALGTRWLAYSEKKLLPAKRSSGGCEGEGVQSYTATVLYAAKSLGKGLRGLGETVASSLTGNSVSPVVVNNTGNDLTQPGVITILDLHAAKEEKELDDANIETVIAHFTAHSDAIVAMTFDLSGALLMTADKRGHDFHVFRIQPHPGGPTLAAVHHLYILHRGDTTAKVQDMVFSSDTRWAAISTVRGTTHVFPVAPYGGPVGVRTHSTPHVVNRLSRFHRSAGLMDDGTRSHSPVSHTELPLSVYPYSNPRLPPYPHPTVLHPLAQIRQPSSLNHANSQAQQRPQQRQRLHSDDSGTLPLKICACFAPPRAWMYAQRESTVKVIKRAVDSLFIMACHGNMIQYDLEPKPAAGVPKEKVCDDTMIELEVEAKGQWPLIRSPNSLEIVPPLPTSSPLLSVVNIPKDIQDIDSAEDRWLSQVEIVTHAGPHRRLWMGPQFVFKTYNASSGAPVNLVEAEAVEIGVSGGSRPARSNPVNMPHAASRSLVPVVIDGSGSSYEQSPRFMEAYGDSLDSENAGVGSGENQLREDLAEAMLETSTAPHRAPGRRSVFERVGQPVTKVVNPLGTVITVSADEEDVNSSQEFDTAEESHAPEAPRSVCAEEGPASLGDLEPESQILRDLTEICVEMRSASEPAIDSVPDEEIREVKERKALCVEIAPIVNPGGSSIDFEKEEAFRDVPTSLSLCVEQGEIPNSPMTQAKEAAWCKRLDKREDRGDRDRSVSTAQYVVNCDDESVVLMESKVTHGRRGSRTETGRKPDPERSAKKPRNGAGLGKRVESKGSVKKYVLKEHDDSIVIEDTSCEDSRSGCGKRKGCEKTTSDAKSRNLEGKAGEGKETVAGRLRNKSKSSTVSECKGTKIDEGDIGNVGHIGSKGSAKRAELITESSIEDAGRKEERKPADARETDKHKSPASESADDFSSSEYHIVESACCNKDGTAQSDEDIEHIQSSEISQLRRAERVEEKRADLGCSASPSPVLQRKNSKNTISDDDLEYIHSSELVETPDGKCKEDPRSGAERTSDDDSNAAGRRAFSDDDLEHVQHSDVCGLMPDAIDDGRERATRNSQEIAPEQARHKNCKQTKDIVVIESDTSVADVTVIFKPMDSWRSKSFEKKEDSEECASAKDAPGSENPSPLRKMKPRPGKTTSPSNVPSVKRSQTGIEIIDIDAMQKAEMEVLTDATSAPECKILSGPEICGTRAKKSRKNRKSCEGGAQGTEVPGESSRPEELEKDTSSQDPAPEVSWSSVVRKRNSVPSLESEARKEDSRIEVEEAIDMPEAAKCPEKEGTISAGRKKDSRRSSGARGSQVIDKLREAVTEADSEDPRVAEARCSLAGKKLEREARKGDAESNVEESTVEEKRARRKHEPSSKSSMVDKLRGIVSDSEARAELPCWSSFARKKEASPEEDAKTDADFDPITEESDEASSRGNLEPPRSAIDEPREVSETKVESPRASGRSWSSIVRKKSPELEIPRESSYVVEERIRRKLALLSDLEVDKHEGKSPARNADLNEPADSPANLFSLEPPAVSEQPLKVEASKLATPDEGKPNGEQAAEPVFSKEDSSEPEREAEREKDPEKRSDSEQEIVPERSSSSDELNANAAFASTEGDASGREAAERSAGNGSTSSACATSKKGNRSKKKKRR